MVWNKLHATIAKIAVCMVCAASLSNTSCTSDVKPHTASVDYTESEFREGDIVLRYGLGMESRIVGMVSSGDFSHVGLLHLDSTRGWMVIHTVPGEAEGKGNDVAKMEPVDSFFLPDRAQQGGLMHVLCDSATRARAVEYAIRKTQEKAPFDYDYRLSDTAKLYCTQLIWLSYMSQGIDLTDGKRTEMPVISLGSKYIMPIDLVGGNSTDTVTVFSIKTCNE